MTEETKTPHKEDYWFLLFMIGPVAIAPTLADIYSSDFVSQMAIAGLLGAIGGGIGMFVYKKIENTHNIAKSVYLTLILLMMIGIGELMLFAKIPNKAVSQNLITCEICGYKTLKNKGDECDICLIPINETYLNEEEFVSFKELIEEEQAWFFGGEEDITFYSPKTIKEQNTTYVKDENWKPVISLETVEEIKKIMKNTPKIAVERIK